MYCSSDAPIAVDEASTVMLVEAACLGCRRSMAVAKASLAAQIALFIVAVRANFSKRRGVGAEGWRYAVQNGDTSSACPGTLATSSCPTALVIG